MLGPQSSSQPRARTGLLSGGASAPGRAPPAPRRAARGVNGRLFASPPIDSKEGAGPTLFFVIVASCSGQEAGNLGSSTKCGRPSLRVPRSRVFCSVLLFRWTPKWHCTAAVKTRIHLFKEEKKRGKNGPGLFPPFLYLFVSFSFFLENEQVENARPSSTAVHAGAQVRAQQRRLGDERHGRHSGGGGRIAGAEARHERGPEHARLRAPGRDGRGLLPAAVWHRCRVVPGVGLQHERQLVPGGGGGVK